MEPYMRKMMTEYLRRRKVNVIEECVPTSYGTIDSITIERDAIVFYRYTINEDLVFDKKMRTWYEHVLVEWCRMRGYDLDDATFHLKQLKLLEVVPRKKAIMCINRLA